MAKKQGGGGQWTQHMLDAGVLGPRVWSRFLMGHQSYYGLNCVPPKLMY